MLYRTTKSTPQGALAAPAHRPPCPGSLSCRRHGGSPAHPASLICFPTFVQGAGLWDRTLNPVAQLPSSRHLGYPYARPKPKVSRRSPSPSPPLPPPVRQRRLRCICRVVALRVDIWAQPRLISRVECVFGVLLGLWPCCTQTAAVSVRVGLRQ